MADHHSDSDSTLIPLPSAHRLTGRIFAIGDAWHIRLQAEILQPGMHGIMSVACDRSMTGESPSTWPQKAVCLRGKACWASAQPTPHPTPMAQTLVPPYVLLPPFFFFSPPLPTSPLSLSLSVPLYLSLSLSLSPSLSLSIFLFPPPTLPPS